MESASVEIIEEIAARDTWSAEDHNELLEQLFATSGGVDKFRAVLGRLERENPEPSGAAALKVGIARYMLGRVESALEALSNATDNKDRRYFKGQCHKLLRQYDKAAEQFRLAADRGWDADEIELRLCELEALSGNLDEAAKQLDKLASGAEGTADYHYIRGLVDELSGEDASAVQAYQRAREIQPNHSAATFRLAYYYDLHGEDDSARDLYEACVSSPPVHANALLNLSVLYEDAGRYDESARCLRRILSANPHHARARLFLRDAEASKTMYYDEDHAKRIAKRNAVLDIPVTDFELSVRARNCLKKMNIRTLGDLVRTTESELLAYKNFGETSLKEIKDMLSAKGLRLGMELEDEEDFSQPQASQQPEQDDHEQGLLATPLENVEFSVRARRALETLGARTLGDLVDKTESEMLACKNFGQTSLNEVKQRLAEYGLDLKQVG
ncbi:MAG: DNA-directed RNA polymerase subunit alpha C-terminal domain-containing protein [Planctomycetota bacterium]